MLKQQQVIFTKVTRQFNGKRVDFSTNGAQTTGYLDAKKKKKINLDSYFTTYSNINPKQIRGLHVKAKTIKLLE